MGLSLFLTEPLRAGAPLGAPPVTVEVALVTRSVIAYEIQTLGRLEAHARATLKNQIGGVLQEILVADGQAVQAGDPILPS